MKKMNAQLLLKIRSFSRTLFRFKSDISKEILIYIASHDGECALKYVYENINATALAVRQHLQILEKTNYIESQIDNKNKRCKNLRLTKKGADLLDAYEKIIEKNMKKWL